ncbi:Conserved_hypothetical protein [Hexamita inflata]|uniref:Uncharacterized protein n=1 Tax=Hexamita inflata TaxID=28002 RepID=A0AA86UIC8_9EUKA|nr:Conserved hypothetical protein [Hexamita inflata]
MILFNFISQKIIGTLAVHQTLLKSDIQKISQNLCRNQLKFSGETVLYCKKALSLTSVTQQLQFIRSKNQSIYFSLFTEKVQDYFVDFTLHSEKLFSFALLGITSSVCIRNSNIFVYVPHNLAEGNLICLICDVTTSFSNFTLIAKGQNISGLILIGKDYLILQNSLFQFRLKGSSVGGLVQRGKVNLQLISCNLTGYLEGLTIGTLIGVALQQTQIIFSDTNICSNAVNIGQGEGIVVIDGVFSVKCDVCGDQLYTYGICQTMLKFGEIKEKKLVCKSTFIFNEQCTCPKGQVVNQSSCVNILEVASAVIKNFEIYHDQTSQFDLTILNNIFVLNNSVVSNMSAINSTLSALTLSAQQETNMDIAQRYAELNKNILNYVNKVICERQHGKQFVSYQCISVQCPITGQQCINGVCQCLPINAVVQNNICVCPINTAIIDSACVCQITGQMLVRGVCQCVTPGAVASNGQCTCGIDGFNVSNSCSCPSNSQLVNNQFAPAACFCNIDGQVIMNGQCQQCPSGYTVINGSCMYIITNMDPTITCSSQVYFTVFDLLTISNYVITSITGFIFSNGPDIQNSFIDIANNLYSATVHPLFQSQSSFSNIKVQIGTQTLGSGSILTASNTNIINNLNIISKSASAIIVSTQKQLNILQTSSTSANINNLLVNLLFEHSFGNISLIGSITSYISINGYQIIGRYYSSLSVAMIGLEISSSTVTIKNIHFKPTMYDVGNCSSYMMNNVSSSSLNFISIFVQLGTSSQYFPIGTTLSASDKNQFFGGLVQNMSTSSTLMVNGLIFDCYQNFQAKLIQNAGFILGNSFSSSNNIEIQNICFQQNFGSTSLYMSYVGLLGTNKAQIFFKQSVITIVAQNTVNYLAVMGSSQGDVKKQIIDTILQVRDSVIGDYNAVIVASVNGGNFLVQNVRIYNCQSISNLNSGLFANTYFTNFSFLNLQVNSFNISSPSSYTGCIIGNYQKEFSTIIIQNSTFSNVNVTGTDYTGGFVGKYGNVQSIFQMINTTLKSCNITSTKGQVVGSILGCSNEGLVQIQNSTLRQMRLIGNTVKLLIGSDWGKSIYDISTSCSADINYINNTPISNCANFGNTPTKTITGC